MTALNDNIAKLDGFLDRFRKTGIPNRIAGKDAPGGSGLFQNTSPVDKSLISAISPIRWCRPAMVSISKARP